jgi:diaminohydroxyphosphoribosylaminopyrimidine deaminase / 5-amino-6-(5-phosphoribosylamino)uracil reductase
MLLDPQAAHYCRLGPRRFRFIRHDPCLPFAPRSSPEVGAEYEGQDMTDREVSTPQREHDAALMRRALELAARGPLGDPNPRVGAVIVGTDGLVVGEGFHEGAGTPHAEVVALRQAGAAARGGTAFVTLEPCAHTGRTGPCAQALIEAGVATVVFAQSDPTPSAHGGATLLEAAGVRTTAGVLEAESTALNEAWTFSFVHSRPKVTWKFAATLDGRSAAADGSSRWITGPLARGDVHRLRAECDAILVGTGTVIADDPALTVRKADGSTTGHQPLRVVMGLRPIPETARVRDAAAPTLLLATHDPVQVLKELAGQEIHHVWLEGGPTVAAAFLGAGLVDEVIAYLAPALLGSGSPALGDLGIQTMDQALRLTPHEVTTIGPDIRIRASIATPNREGR